MIALFFYFCGLRENNRETRSPPKTPPRGGVGSGCTTPRGSSWDRPLTSIIITVIGPQGWDFGSEDEIIPLYPARIAAETLPVELQSLLSRAGRPPQAFFFDFPVC